MGQFASDLFEGTEDAELSAYNSAWISASYYSGTLEITNGRVRPSSLTNASYYHTNTPASADYSVSAFAYKTSASTNNQLGVTGRQSSSVATYYRAAIYRSTSTQSILQLFKFVSGSATQLGSNAAVAHDDAMSKQVKLEMIGTAIKAYFDGSATPEISVTDSAITAAGYAGIRSFASTIPTDTNGIQFDSWSADEDAAVGVSGTLAATEVGLDTASFTGSVKVQGTLTATETGSDSASGSGLVLVQGTLSATEVGEDVAAFTAQSLSDIFGSLAAVENGEDTASFAGGLLIQGYFTATEAGEDTASVTGGVKVQGALETSESGSDTAFFNGSSTIIASGILEASESDLDTADFSGALPISGQFSTSESGQDISAVSGKVLVLGALAIFEVDVDTAAMLGSVGDAPPANIENIVMSQVSISQVLHRNIGVSLILHNDTSAAYTVSRDVSV